MLMTPRAIGRSPRWARIIRSFTRRFSGWCSNSAVTAVRSPIGNGSRSAPRILPPSDLKIATVGEDYSFIYTQVFGLVLEFCGAGGQVTNRQWVPLGTKDFASVIGALPDAVDAIYLGLGGADAVNFLNQYQQSGGKAHLLGGSIMVDQTILSARGNAKN